KEVALLATLGVLITIFVLVLKKKEPQPIANEDIARAGEIRRQALDKCVASEWKECVEKLDAAKKLDPAGESSPEIRQARENANKALTPPPEVPTTNNTTAPPVTPAPSAFPRPDSSFRLDSQSKTAPIDKAPEKSIGPTPFGTEFTPVAPAPTPMPMPK